jgi:hypothetical protein
MSAELLKLIKEQPELIAEYRRFVIRTVRVIDAEKKT